MEFRNNDRVQLGKGKTVWTVFFQEHAGTSDHVQIQSETTGVVRAVKASDLTLIEAASLSELPVDEFHAEMKELFPNHDFDEFVAGVAVARALDLAEAEDWDGRETPYGRLILAGLNVRQSIQRTAMHVSDALTAKQRKARAKDRVAKQSRRRNR